jgi:hypothetical protein
LGAPAGLPANAGLPDGQFFDRRGLVILSLLGARIFSEAVWVEPDADRIADCRHLPDFGCRQRGGLSSRFIGRRYSVNLGRKVAMLICAVCVVPIVYAYRAEGLWATTLLIGLAAAAHQGFSANLFTTASDMFPSRAVASVVGIGGMDFVPFLMAGTAYLVALGVLQLFVPRLEPVEFVWQVV